MPQIIWLQRSLAPGPETVADLDQREEHKRKAAEQQQAEAERERKAKAKTARTVTANDYDPRRLPPTLRAVGEKLLGLGGTIRIEAGRLVVGLPPGEIGQGSFGMTLVAYLYRGHEPIIEAVGGKAGAVAPSKLPDLPILPSGKLVP